MHNGFALTEKNILITGASSGIGRTVAEICASAEANCIITGRNKARLKETLSSLATGNHILIPADLTSESELNSLVLSLPALNGLVCCAGIVETKLLKFSDESDMNHLFATNCFSAIRLIRTLVQNHKLAKDASIVIISSISGVKCAYLGGSLYGATKGALEGFSKAIALELAPRKIRVNTIVPGMIESPMLDDCTADSDLIEADKKRYPLKRYGRPQDVAYSANFLLSDAASWITGSSLLIDGGYTLN